MLDKKTKEKLQKFVDDQKPGWTIIQIGKLKAEDSYTCKVKSNNFVRIFDIKKGKVIDVSG